MTLDAQFHARAKQLFLDACRLPAGTRDRFLRDACGGDAALLAEVSSLLRFHDEDRGEDETTAASPAPPIADLLLADGRDTALADAGTGPRDAGAAARSNAASTSGAGTTGSRFDIGTHYAGRYRIVDLLGRGGMGEVYRAYDTLLDVPVALKLIARASRGASERVLNEVRLARAITHRSVCRVFDVGEADGEYYFTMEYVDGEHLGSLVRRVERLPSSKVIDIARQLCSGLAAAHAQGVLHRDLKPANVMIDARGDVRIADFGIAVAATDERDGGGSGSAGVGAGAGAGAAGRRERHGIFGTPAYMAPEVLRGAPASVQSDLYAVGLILYELITGQRPDRALPEPPSRLAADVDPHLEQAILQALELLPDDRPASAHTLAAMLPGGDPLQAALDAGETPSPDLVAAAGAQAGLAPRASALLLAAMLLGLLVVSLTAARIFVINRIPLDDPPAVLAARARTFVREATGDPVPAYQHFRLQSAARYLEQISAVRGAEIDPARAALFIYRESDKPIAAALELVGPDPAFEVTLDNPPVVEPGAKALVFDANGRLRAFRAAPSARVEGGRDDGDVDWTPFLRESGVDPARVTRVDPIGDAPPFGARRIAWTARRVDSGEPLRIEAASHGREATFFDVQSAAPAAGNGASAADRRAAESPQPADARATSADAGAADSGTAAPGADGPKASVPKADGPKADDPDALVRSANRIGVVVGMLLLGTSFYLARRNLARGRSDVRGARRLAAGFFVLSLAASILPLSFLPFEIEFLRLLVLIGFALTTAAAAGMFYLALEPFVRGRWPSSLISWNRLLAGRIGDALIARDVLIGAAAATVSTALYGLATIALGAAAQVDRPLAVAAGVYMGVRFLAATILLAVPEAVTSGLLLALIYALLVHALRRTWLANLGLLALSTLLLIAQTPATTLDLWTSALTQVLLVTIFVRFGLVAFVSLLFFSQLLVQLPVALRWDWRAEFSIVTLLLVATIGVLAFRASRGRRPAWYTR